MGNDINDFTAALCKHINAELLSSGEPADYNVDAVEVVDTRNHLFRTLPRHATDEAANIFALRELCRLDEETMAFRPDEGRIRAIARNFFG